MDQVEKLASEIEQIKNRNKRVEAEKAWEISTFRITSITILIYVIAAVVMYAIGTQNYLINALIPSVGYFLSMQSLPTLKKWWISKYLK